MHYLQLENEDLKEEISDNRYDLTSSFENVKVTKCKSYFIMVLKDFAHRLIPKSESPCAA